MQHEMAELPRLAEADGVFFLTLAKGDRTSIATTIQRLIDMLDAMEPDPDFEETGDDEPALAAAERHPGNGWGFGRENKAARREHSQDDWACGESSGEDREDDDERELVSEDEGAQDDREPDSDGEPFLGWSEDQSMHGCIPTGHNPEALAEGAGRWSGMGYHLANEMLRRKGLTPVRTSSGLW